MTSSEDPGTAARLRDFAANPEAVALRRRAASVLSVGLVRQGRLLHLEGHLLGDSRVSDTSPRGNGDDCQVATGYLAQTAGTLLNGIHLLIEAEQCYPAAALARQLVETEYLLWAFDTDHDDAAIWLNSSLSERLQLWQPRHLRKRSSGRFPGKDYSTHCDHGGHPTPEGMQALIGRPSHATGELILVDALGHARRCWQSITSIAGIDSSTDAVSSALEEWLSHDRLATVIRDGSERPTSS